MKFYAGIGSRQTPLDVLLCMTLYAQRLACNGYTLRSGGAFGADTAFEAGAGSNKEIYLPWNGVRRRFPDGGITVPDMGPALKLAAAHHPAWHYCSRPARLLLARNGFQILGADLKTPVDFVLCWTSGAMGLGGTGQALRIARSHNIPIFDLGKACELPSQLKLENMTL